MSTQQLFESIRKLEENIKRTSDTMLADPVMAVLFAQKILNSRFPAAEKIIANDTYSASVYAAQVIKGSWPDGELAISKSAQTSYDYAMLIGKRFEAGEAVIANDPQYAYLYARDVVGKWDIAELVIAKSAKFSYLYARDVIGGRFFIAEPAIVTASVVSITQDYCACFKLAATDIELNPINAMFYARDIIGGRWEPGEDVISKDGHASFLYARDIIGGRWELGESAINNSMWKDLYEGLPAPEDFNKL